ncbi:MAG: YraN family protein [Salinarimonadaceae bacterium]|nr:MAG: YraN family protein [Salinarimonadaceae bacterium]
MAVPTRATRRLALRRGFLAEWAALLFLMLKGYRPLARRFAAAGGEIDLVMRRGRTVVFVEVKARRALDAAREAIGESKRRRFRRAARAWMARNPWCADWTLRADAVFVAPGRAPAHLVDAFPLEES